MINRLHNGRGYWAQFATTCVEFFHPAQWKMKMFLSLGECSSLLIRCPRSSVMALDVGTSKIGVALLDESRRIVPIGKMYRRDDKSTSRVLSGKVKRYDTKLVVVGWPMTLYGTVGYRCRDVENFVERMKAGGVGVPFVNVDERFSTLAARADLRAVGANKTREGKAVDEMAAVHILDMFLSEPIIRDVVGDTSAIDAPRTTAQAAAARARVEEEALRSRCGEVDLTSDNLRINEIFRGGRRRY